MFPVAASRGQNATPPNGIGQRVWNSPAFPSRIGEIGAIGVVSCAQPPWKASESEEIAEAPQRDRFP